MILTTRRIRAARALRRSLAGTGGPKAKDSRIIDVSGTLNGTRLAFVVGGGSGAHAADDSDVLVMVSLFSWISVVGCFKLTTVATVRRNL